MALPMTVNIKIPSVISDIYKKFMNLNVFVRTSIVCSIVIIPVSLIVSFVLIMVGERSMCLDINLCNDMFHD